MAPLGYNLYYSNSNFRTYQTVKGCLIELFAFDQKKIELFAQTQLYYRFSFLFFGGIVEVRLTFLHSRLGDCLLFNLEIKLSSDLIVFYFVYLTK